MLSASTSTPGSPDMAALHQRPFLRCLQHPQRQRSHRAYFAQAELDRRFRP